MSNLHQGKPLTQRQPKLTIPPRTPPLIGTLQVQKMQMAESTQPPSPPPSWRSLPSQTYNKYSGGGTSDNNESVRISNKEDSSYKVSAASAASSVAAVHAAPRYPSSGKSPTGSYQTTNRPVNVQPARQPASIQQDAAAEDTQSLFNAGKLGITVNLFGATATL